jgi:hypothetical protein
VLLLLALLLPLNPVWEQLSELQVLHLRSM